MAFSCNNTLQSETSSHITIYKVNGLSVVVTTKLATPEVWK